MATAVVHQERPLDFDYVDLQTKAIEALVNVCEPPSLSNVIAAGIVAEEIEDVVYGSKYSDAVHDFKGGQCLTILRAMAVVARLPESERGGIHKDELGYVAQEAAQRLTDAVRAIANLDVNVCTRG